MSTKEVAVRQLLAASGKYKHSPILEGERMRSELVSKWTLQSTPADHGRLESWPLLLTMSMKEIVWYVTAGGQDNRQGRKLLLADIFLSSHCACILPHSHTEGAQISYRWLWLGSQDDSVLVLLFLAAWNSSPFTLRWLVYSVCLPAALYLFPLRSHPRFWTLLAPMGPTGWLSLAFWSLCSWDHSFNI